MKATDEMEECNFDGWRKVNDDWKEEQLLTVESKTLERFQKLKVVTSCRSVGRLKARPSNTQFIINSSTHKPDQV
jgi:hypothetical protein